MDIQDKIKKLLALSTSPNEYEAKAALLKARKLMADYKLSINDLQPNFSDKEELIKEFCGILFTMSADPWKGTLAKIIGDAYCCSTFLGHIHRKRTYTIGFIGLKEDYEICKAVYCYAVNFVENEASKIRKSLSPRCSAKEIRNLTIAYGQGFCIGIRENFEEQIASHKKYALILQKPQKVLEEELKLKHLKNPPKAKFLEGGNDIKEQVIKGMQDGKNFNMKQRLGT